MTIGLAIAFCVAYTIAIYALYKIHINVLNVEREKLVLKAEVQAQEIVRRTNELNAMGAKVDKAIREVMQARYFNDSIHAQLEEKNDVVTEIHRENLQIYASNIATLKQNKMEVFNIRQAALFTWDQYRSMADLLRHLLVFDDGESPVFNHLRNGLDVVNESMKKVEHYFRLYFRVSPAEYRDKKKILMGKRENGTDYPITNFSAS